MINILKEQTPNRIYYQKFKERVKAYSRQYFAKLTNDRIECPCGKNIFIRNQKRHEKSLKHLKYVLTNNK